MLLLVKNKPKPDQKRLCVIRYGAWGDAIMLSPVFKYYKQEGWHITLNCTEKCYEILKTDPNIDAYVFQLSSEINFNKLGEHWKKLDTQFDKVVNFSGSIEQKLLIGPSQKEYTWSRAELHKRCEKNYYDQTMEVAGFPDKKGEIGSIYFTKQEEQFARKYRKKYKGFFVLWCLTGSAIHKMYPFAENVVRAIVEGIPEAHVILVGEAGCKGLMEFHPRIIDKCGDFGIRESFVLAKNADLVVSTETSVLAAAGCFDTPKVALLSHGSEENVTKHYKNCHVVRQSVPCAPCHKLHYVRATCPLVPELNHPICMGLLHPKKVLEPIERVYINWKNKNLRGD